MKLHPTYPVVSSRIALRPVTSADVPAMLAYRGRPDTCRFVPFEPMTADDIASRVANAWTRTSLDAEGQHVTLAVEVLETNDLIGDVILMWHSATHRSGEIGYIFNPEFGGHGYATEAVNALIGLAFDQLGLHRVVARIDSRNHASAQLAARLGMRQEAHFIRNEWFKGEWTDELVFALLADEWAAPNA